MTLSVTLGENTFTAIDVELEPEFVGMFRSWLNAQNLEPVVTIEELTEQARTNNDTLQAAVDSFSGIIKGEA